MTITASSLDFKLFLALWNRAQGQRTPEVHFKMAEWLEQAWEKGEKKLLLQAFRSCGKSTIVGLFAAWLLYQNNNVRILVLSADEALAGKMVRNVKRVIERHPATAHLKPARADQWGSDKFTIRREMELRDPSMLARGIGGNITGSRADVVICDDVEVPKTCDTVGKREDLRTKLAEVDFVLAPGGTQLYVGTPHHFHTIYAKTPRRTIGETRAFLEEFARLEIPILDETGGSAWPERFSAADIALMKLRAGPALFDSQMMLKARNIMEGRLDPARLRRYDDELVFQKELRTLWIGEKKIVSCSAWWDPAFGSAHGDGSVLAALFTDEDGDYWLHRVAYVKNDPSPSANEDEASAQCRQIARIARELMLPALAVEINGIGRFLPSVLRRALVAARVPCAVIEKTSTRPKDQRILEAFDAVLAARALHVHESVYDTPFIGEMQEWKPGGKSRDDGLDAVAGALGLAPVRIKTGCLPGTRAWRAAPPVHNGAADWRV